MYKQCQTEQSSARQRELENLLLEYLKDVPYEDITISGFCRLYEIPRAAFYRYFATIPDALNALIDHRLLDCASMIQMACAHTGVLSLDIKKYFQYWHDQKELLDALRDNGLTGMLLERASLFAQEEVRQMSPHPDQLEYKEMTYLFSSYGLMAAVIHWHKTDFHQSIDSLSEITTRILSTPLSVSGS